MNRLFISYRRDGGSWSTRVLHDRLSAHYGAEQVFMDVTDIDYGSDFADHLAREVGRCDAMLVVISPTWISIEDAAGRRRLDNPDDYVRLEVGMALQRRIPVVPVLVDGASMPDEAALPDELKALVRHNAIELRHAHAEADVDLLLASLDRSLGATGHGEKVPTPGSLARRYLPFGAAAIALLVGFGWFMTGGDEVTSADDGGVAVSGDMHVGGDLTINQGGDPKLLQLVEDTVAKLTAQLESKDGQIRMRDQQTEQLSAAVAALAQRREQPDSPAGLAQALDNLATGDAAAAKALFHEILEKKSAEAKAATQAAARAAEHLGALAMLDDEQEARQAYKRAIELDPDNASTRQLLAGIKNEPGQLRLQAALNEGGEPIKTCFSVYHAKQDIDGKRKWITEDCEKTARFKLNQGRYYIWAQLGNASAAKEIDISPGGLVNEVINLTAGQLRLQAALNEGGEPIKTCFSVYHARQDIDGKRKWITEDCEKTARFTLNQGRYYIWAKVGDATAAKEIDISPGGLVNEVINLTAGQLRLQAALNEGGESIKTCFSVYHAKQDIDGKRKWITEDCEKTARFTLNQGRYYIWAKVGNASAAKELEIAPGGLVNEVINLTAGQLRLQAALNEGGESIKTCFSVYHAKQDIDGKRKWITEDCEKTARFTLNQGRYYIWAKTGNATAAKELEIAPGGLVNEVINLTASQLRLQAALNEGGEPIKTCFSVYHAKQDIDGKRKWITEDCEKTARFTLNQGRYYIWAKVGNASAAKELEIAPGGLIDERLVLHQPVTPP